MKKLACFALLLFTIPSFAQDLQIKGNTQYQPYRIVRLEASVDLTNKYAVWHITPSANVDKWIGNGRLIFTAPPGTYTVDLSVIDFDKKTGQEATVDVLIAGSIPPNPNPIPPNPNPVPPIPPTDPFFAQIQAAYTAALTTDKLAKVQRLAQVFTQMVPTANDTTITTLGQLRNVLVAATTQILLDEDLPAVRKLIADELDKQLGQQVSLPLTTDIRSKVVTQYQRMAAALNGVK